MASCAGHSISRASQAVSKKTRLIVVTNPNNPSGGVLNQREMDEIVRVARKANAWLLADEIYRGAEVSGPLTPTFWGRYDKLLVTSGLSKAFGAPGLRIGWIAGPPKAMAKLCTYHDYTTLTPTMLVDRLARIMMRPARREKFWNAPARSFAATCRSWKLGSIRTTISSPTSRP